SFRRGETWRGDPGETSVPVHTGASLSFAPPPVYQNAKSLSSSDSLAKVQEVASWLLEMNQDLLSGGSGSRAAQQQRPGAGNSTSGRAPQPQAEHMNRVLEEQEQEAQQQRREAAEEEEDGRERPRDQEEEPWPSGAEPVEEGRRSEVNGAEKGAQWMWEQEQHRRRRRHREEEEENEEEEEEGNNNGGREGQVRAGLRSDQNEDDEEDGEEEMDQDSDEFEHSEESGREEEEEAEDEEEGEEGLHSPSLRTAVTDLNDNTDQSSGRQHQSSPSFCKNKMKRKLDHGPEVRSFPSGKKPCPSPTGLPFPATPTTFRDIRAVNGQGQQRRRITSIQPPTGLQEWLHTFQSWSGPEKLLALDELIDSCEPTQVKHMMQVIEPQFQRDFISLLPRELALHVLSFLEPKDLLQAAQTCRYWRILAEDNLLWREKCKEEGIDEPLHIKRRKVIKPGFAHSPWKSAYIRQHRIDTNWRRGDLKSPKVLKGHDDHVITCLQFCGNCIVSGSDDNTLKVWSAVTGKCLRTLVGHTGGVWSSQMRDNIIISGSTDRTLKVWNAESGECIHTLYGHTSTVRCMHLHEKRLDPLLLQFDGIHVVSGSLDTSIRVWDVETGNCIHTLTGHQSLTSGMELKDNILVSGNADSTVKIWDIKTGQCLQTLQGPHKHQSAVTCLQFNKNFVITSSDDGTVKLWDLRTGEFIRNLVTLESGGSGGVVWRIRASNTKLVCAVGSRNGTEETKLLVLDFDVDMK
ncbi:F-box/WD repeat-containing protein 7-like, partial [Sinocyclocheilus rhinocerous]|uniref:F-box/WD repeat-containing protein 7-like n=1 Tax=Sinocyclocheilus rhinocerous TaxID=307959 RepID=UPI0007B8E3B1